MSRYIATLLVALLSLNIVSAQSDETVIKPTNKWYLHFQDGRAVVKSGYLYGYVDRAGHQVIPFRYDKAYTFNNGIAMVREAGEMFAIDTTGRRLACAVVIPQFRGRDFERFVSWVYSAIRFADEKEILRLQDAEVNAVITLSGEGRITACTNAESSSDEAYRKIEKIALSSEKWQGGSVDGAPCYVNYLLPISFRNLGTRYGNFYPIDDKGQRIIGANYTPPTFRGGNGYMFNYWCYKNSRFKDVNEYYRAQSGEVRYSVIIDKSGRLRDITITESHNDACRRKLEDMLNKSPRWEPGKINGKAVTSRYESSYYFKFR